MKVVNAPARSPSLLPESVRNLVESINSATRIVLKASRAAEKSIDGFDELGSLLLRQQRQRLMAEIEPEPRLIE